MIFDELMDSKPLFLTGNTDTVYCSVFLDLEKDGPTVIEIPPKTGPGTVNDAYFRFVIDTGAPGPDRGEGGKYLILPPDYEGQVPDGYFTAKSTSYVNWLILRGFLVDGKPDFSSNLFRTGLKVYPLAKADDPPAMEFINGSRTAFNTIHANSFEFFEELHAVIEREPIAMLDPELRGLFASVGIQKGKPFAPDERMKKILTDAVAVANGTARALLWYERNESEFLAEGSHWKKGFVGDSWEYLRDEGMGGRHLDARTHFYYFATVNTPAMAMKLIGAGSQYAWGYLDSKGNPLDGSKSYKLNIPANVPAKDFLVGRGLRPADPLGTADGPAVPEQEQPDETRWSTTTTAPWISTSGPKRLPARKSNWIADGTGQRLVRPVAGSTGLSSRGSTGPGYPENSSCWIRESGN